MSHRLAAPAFEGFERRPAVLVTTSYVLVETCALLARRAGMEAVRRFREAMTGLLDEV